MLDAYTLRIGASYGWIVPFIVRKCPAFDFSTATVSYA